MAFTFHELRSLIGSATVIDLPCPLCLQNCKTTAGRRRKCLRIWQDRDDGGINYVCARCGVDSYARPEGTQRPVQRFQCRPATLGRVTQQNAPQPNPGPEAPPPSKSQTARHLWSKSTPLVGSLAETYTRARECYSAEGAANLRFLPAAGPHPPSMVARFGHPEEAVTGIHLTKLRPDGSGKAGTDADKLTLGDSMGQPIILHSNDDREELIVTEGIEDALSLVLVTGWSAWAAGTANRIPPVVATARQRGFSLIYLAADDDPPNTITYQPVAAARALADSRRLAPGLIPVNFTRTLGQQVERMDANSMLRQYGPIKTLAVIDYCAAQAAYHANQLRLHAFLAEKRKYQLQCR